MRFSLLLCVTAVAWSTGLATATALEWEEVPVGSSESGFVAVALSPEDPARVFAASRRAVYESRDNGRHWQERFRVPTGAAIVDLAVSAATPTAILSATTQGLYGSLDNGATWSRLYHGATEGEQYCTYVAFHPARKSSALLGTRGGLFISYADGRSWAEVRTPLAAREVVSFAFDPQDPDRLYLVAAHGLFIGSLVDGDWQQRFSVLNTEDTPPLPSEGLEAQQTDEATEEEAPAHQLTAVAVDPNHPSTVYLGGSHGLDRSLDAGKTWEPLPRTGLISTTISRLLPYAYSPLVIYAATPHGVARFDPQHGRWRIITTGRASTSVNDLAATPNYLWAATDHGLYRFQAEADSLDTSEPPTARELLNNFSYEPTISQVRDAAIRYAEVHPDKIKWWRRQAALQALLPSVNLGIDHDRSRDNHVDEGSFPSFQVIKTEDRDAGLDFSITWDLGELIWNDDQTAIDVRSKLMVQLRDDLIDEVTRTYFERRRLQVKLLTDPPSDQQKMLEHELRIQELTALIDGLTGGYFSASTRLKSN